MTPVRLIPVLALVCLTSGGCLDLLGHEEDVTQHAGVLEESRIEDDRIEDKHPAFDPARAVSEAFGPGACSVTMNKSAAVTKLDIIPFGASETALAGTLFRGRGAAIAALGGTASAADVIPSMEVVNGNLKPFNDGLTATIELAIEADKRALLPALLARLAALSATAPAAARPALDDATVLVGAALILGGSGLSGSGAPALDATLQARAQARADAFVARADLARPIGFYTWSADLARIFTRDRFLQNRDDGESFAAFAALAAVLAQDPALRASYQRVTALYAGLTNPYVSYTIDALVPHVTEVAALADPGAIEAAFRAAHPPLRPCLNVLVAFLPASRSKEVDLFDASFCYADPGGTNLLDFLVAAIQDGRVDLTPGVDSGWYDYQLSALETLLVPGRAQESQNLLLTAGYKKKLVETFKSILIQDRETHVKDLAVGARGGSLVYPPVDIYPLLPAEPFPTFYLRTARGYRFLRVFLRAALGESFLPGNARLEEGGGHVTATLAAELDARIALLYGLSFLTADAVGSAPDASLMADELAEIDVDAARAAARAFAVHGGWRTDPDVLRDPRVIVPIYVEGDGSTRYWAVIGIKALKVHAGFVSGHEPLVTPTGCWTGNIVAHDYTLLVEESAEVRLGRDQPPPTRDELRAICDAHTTRDEIVAALGSR